MSDEDAEEYAMDEHHVSIPIADWSKSSEAPMRIGEFLFCRSPELISQIDTRRDRPNVLDLSPQNQHRQLKFHHHCTYYPRNHLG